MLLHRKQLDLDPAAKDYGYIEYLRKPMTTVADSDSDSHKQTLLNFVMFQESKRDYFTASLRQVNNLIQIDEKPNLEFMEPKWELYKISISFQPIGKFRILMDLEINLLIDDYETVPRLKGSKHRVFFQNAEGNINMGVLFNDPDVGLDEIFWYNELALAIYDSLKRNEGLISIDDKLNTRTMVPACFGP